jgi:hypothetical protein
LPDRGLIGLVAIALVAATAISLLTFNVKEEERVRFAATQVPDEMGCGLRDTQHHSFDVMATTDLPDLVIRTGFLMKPQDHPMRDPWNMTGTMQREVITGLLDGLKDDTGSERYSVIDIDDASGRKLNIVDVSDSMAVLLGEDLLKDFSTIYALEEDAQGRLSFYRGPRDFFFDRDITITEIVVTRGGETQVYSSNENATKMGYATIAEAPMGKIHLRDLSAGERIHVEVTVMTAGMPCHEGLIRVVRTDTGYGPGPIMISRID